MRELKERMEYKKPSEKRREVIQKAIYKQKFDDENEI